MSNIIFNYTLEPGKIREESRKYQFTKPVISVIIPFYNDEKYIQQTIQCILNQTYPFFEVIVVDDGSTNPKSLETLREIEKLDERIQVLHKENAGVSAARDYGAKQVSDSVKYLIFLDSDDLIEKTYLECAYWTLETNKEASWAYTDSLGFQGVEYLWNKWFDSELMKKENNLVATALIRKEDFWEVKGFELREKYVYEDWNLWLKLIAKGKFPVRMNFYGMWYRRKEEAGELAHSADNKQRAYEIVNATAKTIQKPVQAIQYPRQDYKWDLLPQHIEGLVIPKPEKDEKINLLMIIPWMVTGGADKFNLDLIKGLNKEKFRITIVSTEPSVNVWRQEFEQYATVYDVSTFLDRKYWTCFIDYIMTSQNINLVMNTNSKFGYTILPYLKAKHPEVPIVDYIHMEEWYNRNGGYSRDSSAVGSLIDKTLLCNKNSETILVEHFGRKPEEVETVYIGGDEKAFDPTRYSKEEIYKKYAIYPKGKKVIGFICRITEQKRPYLFLRIIEELKKERKDFLVLVVGNGNMLKEIKAKAKKLGLLNEIIFLGNKKETQEIYAISDVTLNSSLKEGLALTAYESLAMGVPVVSCDVGGQKELITKEVGVIVPCLQEETDIYDFDYSKEEVGNYVVALNQVLDHLEEYQSHCRNRILEGFTIDHMVQKMNEELEKIATHPNLEKVQQAKQLLPMLDITKELITQALVANTLEYTWQCDCYNVEYYKVSVQKRSIVKERLWTIPAWRSFIHVLQKTGVMRALKRIFRKE